jgi:predicted amidohydrolase
MRPLVPATLVLLVACAPGPKLPADDTECALSFSDEGDARVFVVGHRFLLSDAISYESFEASYAEDMRAVAPCLSKARPNLVVFPEDAGLIAWFSGPRALLARGASDVTTAFSAMYAGWAPAADAYRERFPGISVARGLTLALGDVAWRSMDRTFGGIARRYGVHVITSANVPYVRREASPLLRDPAAPAGELAYVATGSEVFNSALWYGPDGKLAGRVDKVFLTDPEVKDLDLSPGRLDAPLVLEMPFGRVGVAISRDAFYPPFVQRLEDEGAELVVQPEAWTDGWMLEDAQGGWLPDVILSSGWSLTQKYRGITASAAPMLHGNLFDMRFDGQVWLTRKATPAEVPQGFVGSQPLRGWRAIGPWAMEDPVVREPGLSLEERRARLLEEGRALLPGGKKEGAYRRALVAADLFFHGDSRAAPAIPVTPGTGLSSSEVALAERGHQSNVEAAVDGQSHVYAVFSDTRTRWPQVMVAVSEDGGAHWREALPVAPSSSWQLRPTVAAHGDGRVVVAWQEESKGRPARIRVAVSEDGGRSFSTVEEVEATGAAQWEPRLAFRPGGGALALVWMDFREGLASKVRLARSVDGGRTWGASMRVDPGGVEASRIEGMQAQPALTWTDSALAVVWVDYRERDWEVWASVVQSLEGNGTVVRVSPASETEALAAAPVLTEGPDGTLVLAWEDLRERRGHRDVRFARWSLGEGWGPLPGLTGGADDGAFVSRFRPSLARVGGSVRAMFQDMTPGKNSLQGVTVPGVGGAPVSPSRLDDTGDAANQLTSPRVISTLTGALVLFEDDRSGWSRIRRSLLELGGPSGPEPVPRSEHQPEGPVSVDAQVGHGGDVGAARGGVEPGLGLERPPVEPHLRAHPGRDVEESVEEVQLPGGGDVRQPPLSQEPARGEARVGGPPGRGAEVREHVHLSRGRERRPRLALLQQEPRGPHVPSERAEEQGRGLHVPVDAEPLQQSVGGPHAREGERNGDVEHLRERPSGGGFGHQGALGHGPHVGDGGAPGEEQQSQDGRPPVHDMRRLGY